MLRSTEKILSSLIIFIPFFIILGPAIPDIIISLSAIYALSIIVKEKKYDQLKEPIFIAFFIFWFSIILSSIFSDNKSMSLSSSILYVRFIFFLLFIKLFFSFDTVKKFNPFLILTLCLCFVIFDSYVQFFFRIEIFGNYMDNPVQVRLTGPFLGGEQIVGSYLSKFGYISFGYLLGLYIDNRFKKDFLLGLFFVSIYVIIFLTGERMAFILFNFGILIFFIFDRNFFLKIIRLLIICMPILFIVLISSQSNVIKRAFSTFDILGINFKKNSDDTKNFFDSHYGAHYLTAFEIFKDNPFIGVGNKMYREKCNNEKYENIKSKMVSARCSTHPHNIYFQVISENGLIGLSTFLILVYIIIRKSYLVMIKENSYLSKSIFVSLVLFLWPLQSNGGLYNNRYSTMLFFILALLILIKERRINLNN